MKILVTGSFGFIGSQFVKMLIEDYPEVEVRAFVRNSDQRKSMRLSPFHNHPRLRLILGDLTDINSVSGLAEGVDVICNFAAKTFVDHSIKDASAFVQSNIIGTYNLLEEARKNKVSKYVQVSCYDKETRAVTTNGIKTFKELQIGDKVFTLNPKTLALEIQLIDKIIIQNYNGDMYWFNNGRIDLKVTPNHRMYIKGLKKGGMIIEEAEKAAKRKNFQTLLPQKWDGINKKYINIKKYGKIKTEDYLYLIGAFIGDGFLAIQKKRFYGISKKERLKNRDKNTGQFTKIHNNIKKEERYMTSYRIFFKMPKIKKSFNKITEILDKINVNYKYYNAKAGECIYFSSKEFCEIFAECGKGAINKKIPPKYLRYSKKYLKYLYDGLMETDGSSTGKLYSTSSKELRNNFIELCLKLGYKISYKGRFSLNAGKINGREIKQKYINYCICVGKQNRSITNKKIYKEKYNGKIWCIRVKNKNFLVERNGKLDFSGNTDEVYGSILEGAYKEDAPLNPTNPYSATKAAADMLVQSYGSTYGLKYIITRTENNFGKFQHPQKAMPVFIKHALNDSKIPVYGDGGHMRQWIRVEDHCLAIMHLISLEKEGIYHVAGEQELQNVELAERILSILKKPKSLIEFVPDFDIRPGHDRRYALNCDKLKSTGWRPKWDLQDGLEDAVKWYKENDWWLYG